MLGKLIPRKEKPSDLKSWRDESNPVARLRRDFDDLWDRFLEDWRSGDMSLWEDAPGLGGRVDWDDARDEYVLRAELPGFDPDEIDVKVSGHVMTVRAEHREEGEEKDGGYRRYGTFYESFTLPRGVRDDAIDARFHNGLLEIHLPKSEESQAKRIDVQAH